jgi:hypothetical protein
MSDFRMPFYKAVPDPARQSGAFIRAASDYSQLGIDCFNMCVDPNKEVTQDQIRGMEKRCMDGCLTVNLQIFTTYGTQFSD